MTQAETYSTSSSVPLPDVFSAELVELFTAVQPGIVQVQVSERGGGTGIIWQSDGRIITNNHVVARASRDVQVVLPDGRTFAAKVLHRNPQLDLALLSIEGEHLHALSVGDSSALRVGEWVFAIGHPWGQRWALTAGIVSTKSSVQLASDLTTEYIKSDVRLAPGNSGGPLLNADGQVVGVNAMIFGGDLSVAIPSNVVSAWLARLPQARVTLGIHIQAVTLSETLRERIRGERTQGLLVVDTSARQLHPDDLLVGDILLEVAGKPVSDGATLRALLAQSEAGKSVPMTIARGGNVISLEVTTQTQASAPAA